MVKQFRIRVHDYVLTVKYVALEDDPYNFHQIHYQQEQPPYVRPGSSLGLNHQTSRGQGHDIRRAAGDDREPEPSDQQSRCPFFMILFW